MDYRYETKNDSRSFHKQRKAFIIYKNNVEYLPKNSELSHFEYCKSKGIDKDEFNTLIRGYFLNGNLVFYKDNFTYDEQLINESLKYLKEISKDLDQKQFNIYYGHLPKDNFKLDLFYGEYINGIINKKI